MIPFLSSPLGLRICDGALICIDAVEGVMLNTERCIRQALAHGLPLAVVFTKMDRLITDLKLPPGDAYYKLVAMLEDVNTIIDACIPGAPRVNPLNGNVVFCSARHRWSFTLQSFARHYSRIHENRLPVDALARRLWGNVWFNYQTRRFEGKTADSRAPRSFVQFCLEPMCDSSSSLTQMEGLRAGARQRGLPAAPRPRNAPHLPHAPAAADGPCAAAATRHAAVLRGTRRTRRRAAAVS